MLMLSKFFLDWCIDFKHYNDEGFSILYPVLFVAASLGLKDLIGRLVTEKKADLNIKGFCGLSVLHCACFGRHVLYLWRVLFQNMLLTFL